MKIYTYEDSLFCYLYVCVAASREAAMKQYNDNNIHSGSSENPNNWEEHEITEGWHVEGGGNG